MKASSIVSVSTLFVAMATAQVLPMLKGTAIKTNVAAVGTTDQPTIDGGVINNADSFSSTSSVALAPEKFDDPSMMPKVDTILERAAATGQLKVAVDQSLSLGLPANLALVPLIESAYQDHAVSNKGALGAWQLMPNTAKAFGLAPQDAFNFAKATPVALNYLANLHHTFGRWDLALAAYNCGEGCVTTAIHDNPDFNSIDDLALPNETKNYVHNFIAAENSILTI